MVAFYRAGGRPTTAVFGTNETNGTKRIPFFKNEPEKLLKTQDRLPKTNRNEPKNEAEKLLKTLSCGKNEAKNEPNDVVENKAWRKNEPKTNRSESRKFASAWLAFVPDFGIFSAPHMRRSRGTSLQTARNTRIDGDAVCSYDGLQVYHAFQNRD